MQLKQCIVLNGIYDNPTLKWIRPFFLNFASTPSTSPIMWSEPGDLTIVNSLVVCSMTGVNMEFHLARVARQKSVRCVELELITQPALQFLHALFEPPAQAIPEAFCPPLGDCKSGSTKASKVLKYRRTTNRYLNVDLENARAAKEKRLTSMK